MEKPASSSLRDLAADARESTLDDRERELDLRGEKLRERVDLEATLAERDALLVQMREANEKLVFATLRADELADIAAYNERRFRALATTTAAVIWRADPSGQVYIEQDSWGAFGGLAGDDPRWNWLHAIPAGDHVTVRDAWTHARMTVTPYRCQHRLRVRDGQVWVVARAVPIVVDGVLREWIGMMTDITDRVRIDEAKEQFIAILGHDLRNPLAAISLGAEAFQGMSGPHGRIAAQMLRSVHRMQAMIYDVMDFTRSRLGGGIPVTRAACNLGVLAHEVVAEMKQAHPTRDLRCEAIGDLDGAYDPDRTEQVFSNLLGNAIAHGLDPILLTVRTENDDITITVHNRGAPIPAGMIPTLSEPFLRGREAPPQRANQGLGLGLYIVSEIVRAHGGSIAITSTLEEGTRVTIRWPLEREPVRG